MEKGSSPEKEPRKMQSLRNFSRRCPAYLAAFVLFAIITLSGKSLWAEKNQDARLPFGPGERLTFALSWAAIPAGEAVMEVLPMKDINGEEAYHFRLTAESNAFVDVFYKVRDRIDAFAAADMSRTVHYIQKKHEGRTRKNLTVEFDWDKTTARYSDEKRVKEPISIKPGTFDPLSVFYYSRTVDLAVNRVMMTPVTDGSKCVMGMARIVGRETISVPGGTYDTFVIEPELKHIGGVFEKKKGAKITLWVSADERRLPVKIASQVAIGSFVGELVSVEDRTL
jgi:hypothetical protein